MGLSIYIDHQNGEPFEKVAEITDRRVTRLGINSERGESGAMLIPPNQAEVVLRYEWVALDGRPTLTDIESFKDRTLTGDQVQDRIDELSELPTAQNQGSSALFDASVAAAARQAQEDEAAERRALLSRPEDATPQDAPVDSSPVEGDQVDPPVDDGSGHGAGEAGSTDPTTSTVGGSATTTVSTIGL